LLKIKQLIWSIINLEEFDLRKKMISQRSLRDDNDKYTPHSADMDIRKINNISERESIFYCLT
jgi:hypothetical protein